MEKNEGAVREEWRSKSEESRRGRASQRRGTDESIPFSSAHATPSPSSPRRGRMSEPSSIPAQRSRAEGPAGLEIALAQARPDKRFAILALDEEGLVDREGLAREPARLARLHDDACSLKEAVHLVCRSSAVRVRGGSAGRR